MKRPGRSIAAWFSSTKLTARRAPNRWRSNQRGSSSRAVRSTQRSPSTRSGEPDSRLIGAVSPDRTNTYSDACSGDGDEVVRIIRRRPPPRKAPPIGAFSLPGVRSYGLEPSPSPAADRRTASGRGTCRVRGVVRRRERRWATTSFARPAGCEEAPPVPQIRRRLKTRLAAWARICRRWAKETFELFSPE